MLLAVDESLAFYPPDAVSQELVDAYSYTNTFANAVARRADRNPNSFVYFSTKRDELSRIGWNITEAGQVTYEQKQRRISPADIVRQIIHPYLTGDQENQLNGILNVIQQPESGIHDFLTFWWNKSTVNAGTTQVVMGPLTSYLGMPSISLLFYSFAFQAESWRSLFVELDEASLNTQVYHLKMDLNMGLYNHVKDALIERVAPNVNNHVDTVPLDL